MEYEAEGFSQCSSDLGNEPDLHGTLDLLERCSWTCGSAGEIKLSQERVQCVALHSEYTVAPKGYGRGCCLAGPGGPGGTQCSCRE